MTEKVSVKISSKNILKIKFRVLKLTFILSILSSWSRESVEFFLTTREMFYHITQSENPSYQHLSFAFGHISDGAVNRAFPGSVPLPFFFKSFINPSAIPAAFCLTPLTKTQMRDVVCDGITKHCLNAERRRAKYFSSLKLFSRASNNQRFHHKKQFLSSFTGHS